MTDATRPEPILPMTYEPPAIDVVMTEQALLTEIQYGAVLSCTTFDGADPTKTLACA